MGLIKSQNCSLPVFSVVSTKSVFRSSYTHITYSNNNVLPQTECSFICYIYTVTTKMKCFSWPPSQPKAPLFWSRRNVFSSLSQLPLLRIEYHWCAGSFIWTFMRYFALTIYIWMWMCSRLDIRPIYLCKLPCELWFIKGKLLVLIFIYVFQSRFALTCNDIK